jgi:DNA-binding HxlR family transcriptional regulator
LQTSLPFDRADPPGEIFLPRVRFIECPIKASLGVLEKKWTMLILRDIVFCRIERFNGLVKSIQGITPRVLSKRLKELEEAGFIECIEYQRSPMNVRWTLSQKGNETLSLLMRFIAFGSKWHADQVFEDKIPRTLPELFGPAAIKIMRRYE